MNLRTLTAFAACAALVAPAAASAFEPQSTAAARVGGFDATGVGTVAVTGNLTVFGRVTGLVLVRDRVGGAVVKIKGVRQKPKLVKVGERTIRVYTLRKVNGSFYVKGNSVRVELRSAPNEVSVTAVGRGTINKLAGDGIYHLNGGDDLDWATAITPIAIKPPPKDPAPTRTAGAEPGPA